MHHNRDMRRSTGNSSGHKPIRKLCGDPTRLKAIFEMDNYLIQRKRSMIARKRKIETPSILCELRSGARNDTDEVHSSSFGHSECPVSSNSVDSQMQTGWQHIRGKKRWNSAKLSELPQATGHSLNAAIFCSGFPEAPGQEIERI